MTFLHFGLVDCVVLEELTLTCEAANCERQLEAESPAISFSTPAGVQRAYECECGAVTITVAREE